MEKSNICGGQFFFDQLAIEIRNFMKKNSSLKVNRKIYIISPPVIVFGRTYVLLWFFFLFFRRVISELHRPIGAKFCTMLGAAFNFIIPVQNFGGTSPKNFQGLKTCKIWPDFGRLRSLAANISGTDKDIQNR